MATVNGVQNDNSVLYGVGGAAVGAAAGGAGGYYLTKIAKEGKATDKFVKTAAEVLKDDAAFKEATKVAEEATNYFKSIEGFKLPEGEEAIKTFRQEVLAKLKGHGVETEEITALVNKAAKPEEFKQISELATTAATTGKQKGFINGFISNEGKLIENNNKPVMELLQKAANQVKKNAAIWWGAGAAVALGIIAYFMSKPSKADK